MLKKQCTNEYPGMSTTETQTQKTQTETEQEQKQKAVIVKLQKKDYNILRSFIESSLKSIYAWNKPLYFPDGAKQCTMYGDGKRWRIIICDNKTLYAGIKLTTDNDKVIVEYFWLQITCENNNCTVTYTKDNAQYNADIANVIFMSDVVFAKPIRLSEVVDKLNEYEAVQFDVVNIDLTT